MELQALFKCVLYSKNVCCATPEVVIVNVINLAVSARTRPGMMVFHPAQVIRANVFIIWLVRTHQKRGSQRKIQLPCKKNAAVAGTFAVRIRSGKCH